MVDSKQVRAMTDISRRTLLKTATAALLAAGAGQARAGEVGAGEEGLAAIAERRGILFGTAVARHRMAAAPEMARLVRDDAAVIVPELELKWQRLRPTPAEFDFQDADFL